jgi:hypothetical protein
LTREILGLAGKLVSPFLFDAGKGAEVRGITQHTKTTAGLAVPIKLR